MGFYRKRPVEIEAWQLIGTSPECFEVYQWVESHIGSVDPYGDKPGVTIDPEDGALMIKALEGDMKASIGDWIIRGVQGEFYPVKPDIFEATYESVTLLFCAETGCGTKVHKEGWRCDSHVPPCGWRGHSPGCTCSRNECSPTPA